MSSDLIRRIDYMIKDIWIHNISNDYSTYHILKEDSLKSCFYHHLRNALSRLLEEEDLRIYTEFNEKGLKANGWRADIAVVRLGKPERNSNYLGDYTIDVLAMIELKFQGSGSRGTQTILSDIDKVRDYIRHNRFPHCQYYLGIIHEDVYSLSELKWLNKRQSGSWGDGSVTELNACRFDHCEDEGMGFTVMSYNKMNEEFNWQEGKSIHHVKMDFNRWDCPVDGL